MTTVAYLGKKNAGYGFPAVGGKGVLKFSSWCFTSTFRYNTSIKLWFLSNSFLGFLWGVAANAHGLSRKASQ